ncbi:hypothetical protein LCGC14_1174850 [marine sediment metagenome]|uniref:Uncharacterized protein n=1 Tax=marine sediment metagenome TaxID=412755 RepID=A0A0F9LTN0_9ZZZZ
MEQKTRVRTSYLPETLIESNDSFSLTEDPTHRTGPLVTLSFSDRSSYIKMTPYAALTLAVHLLRWAVRNNGNIAKNYPLFSGPRR